jgi:SAM-dependent methyltransferase
MSNYDFCAQWILERGRDVRVLDYGCGAGEIVKDLRRRNVQAFGCEVFYEGGDTSNEIGSDLLGSVIREMRDGAVPFESSSFDIVINNQVMEHAEDLDSVLAEIARVLKPGGVVLSLFPDKGVWREGHSGVPFLHWFPKRSSPRLYYAAAARLLGLGSHKKKWGGIMNWSRHKCEWLDKWVFYRTRRELREAYTRYFVDLTDLEDHWLQQRLGARKVIAAWLPSSLQRLVVQKMAGLVFTAKKPAEMNQIGAKGRGGGG